MVILIVRAWTACEALAAMTVGREGRKKSVLTGRLCKARLLAASCGER